MKKVLTLVMAFCLALSVFVGCGSSYSYDVKSVVDQFTAVYPVPSAAEIDDDILQDLMQLDLETVEEYYGYRSRANGTVDTVIMVKAKPGKVDTVKTDLEAHRDAMEESSQMYDSVEATKAKNALITVKGDYILFVMTGDHDRVEAGDMEVIKADAQSKIDELLK